jgi:membrane dipeptidase
LHIPSDPSAPPDGDIVFTEDGYEVPLAGPIAQGHALQAAMTSLASAHRLVAAGPDVCIIHTVQQLESSISEDKLGIILHLEGADAIDRDLDALEVFFRAGLRSLGSVWSRPNIFGLGVPCRYPHSPDTGSGLTDIGRALVKECNRLGIMIDASHLNERGFWDLVETTSAPLVATHSAVHSLCQSSRNLLDMQIDAIGQSNGIIGVNFEVSALRTDGRDDPNTGLEILVRHIDYLVGRIGIDRVGFGSDFDGATMSRSLSDAGDLPNLVNALREKGYDYESICKLAYRNWLRVLGVTWRT